MMNNYQVSLSILAQNTIIVVLFDTIKNLADSGNTCQIRYLYLGNLIPKVMTRYKESYNRVYIIVLLWIGDFESIVVSTLGWELVHTWCCVFYLGPLPGKRKLPCYNFCVIISVISRIS
jgi:hypothetical protein